ncbi:MAG TPA: sigma-70 family RNA polymerase sigma factor, partial [Planctomycetota bacterium]|nr:sigma-70 family RNA polymerase sigma factor [Planctomycetota bacterium]
MARAPTPDVATLLAHEPFVRALAQRLVGAGDEADEVAQETLVRALEHPPEPRLGLAGWLTTVARNVVRQRRRGDRRRVRREAVAARLDSVPSTETILEREVARRTVVEAVLDLDEPYRTVVVLRWLEGLPPREVAARLSIPVETVRTRSRRAIEQLRERLDRRHGGRRATWLAALVPLAGTPPSATVARPRTLPLPALTAAAVGAAAVLVVVAAPGRVDDPGPATGAVPARSHEGGDVGTNGPRSWIPPEPKERSPLLAAGPATGPGIVRGFVLEPGRRPAAGARVRVRRATDATSRGEVRETATDAQGRFAVEHVPLGPWIVEADSPTGRASTLVRAGRDPAWASLWLAPAAPVDGSLWVRVLGTDGRTVEGAEVEVVPVGGGAVLASRTAANGYALVKFPLSSTARRALVEVRAAGFLVRRSIAWPALGEDDGDALALDVPLEAVGGLEGRVEAPAGIPLDGSRLVLWPASLDVGTATTLLRVRETAVAADGRFEMDGLAPGPYAIAVRSPIGLRIAEPARSRVEVTSGRRTAVALAVVAGATIRGVVTRSDTGAPIVGARVEWSTGVEAPPDAAAAARLDPRAP